MGTHMENKRRNFAKPAQETDGTVIVGRNPIMELIKSGKDVEKLYIQRGEREGLTMCAVEIISPP